MNPQEWIDEIAAPDMSLLAARLAYHSAQEGAHREACLLAIVRAERRLAVQCAPRYVARILAAGRMDLGTPGMEAPELAAFEAARQRGE